MSRRPKIIKSKKPKIIEVVSVSIRDTPTPNFQVLPAAQVVRGDPSGAGSIGQSGKSGQSSIGRILEIF